MADSAALRILINTRDPRLRACHRRSFLRLCKPLGAHGFVRDRRPPSEKSPRRFTRFRSVTTKKSRTKLPATRPACVVCARDSRFSANSPRRTIRLRTAGARNIGQAKLVLDFHVTSDGERVPDAAGPKRDRKRTCDFLVAGCRCKVKGAASFLLLQR